VILNRVRDLNYPNSICGVVFEGADRTTGCQFSFTCMGALAQAPVGWAWKRSQTVAERMLAGHVATKVGTATHYHADYVHPWWATTLNKLTQIGAHIFYRWKGLSGETGSVSPSLFRSGARDRRGAPVAAPASDRRHRRGLARRRRGQRRRHGSSHRGDRWSDPAWSASSPSGRGVVSRRRRRSPPSTSGWPNMSDPPHPRPLPRPPQASRSCRSKRSGDRRADDHFAAPLCNGHVSCAFPHKSLGDKSPQPGFCVSPDFD
jgi:hypothetical protein